MNDRQYLVWPLYIHPDAAHRYRKYSCGAPEAVMPKGYQCFASLRLTTRHVRQCGLLFWTCRGRWKHGHGVFIGRDCYPLLTTHVALALQTLMHHALHRKLRLRCPVLNNSDSLSAGPLILLRLTKAGHSPMCAIKCSPSDLLFLDCSVGRAPSKWSPAWRMQVLRD